MANPTSVETEPHTCDNGSLRTIVQRTRTKPSKVSRILGICQDPTCRRVWNKMANRDSWYDPNEGPDPSLTVDDGDPERVAHELAEALAATHTVTVVEQVPFCPCPNSYMERTGQHMPGCKYA